MKGLWKKFDRLTSKCYANLVGADVNADVWDKAYEALGGIIHEGREQNSNYARELYLLDDETDYEHDVCGWLEDYLDYLDAGRQYEKLRKICVELMGLFQWKEESPSDFRFYIASSLGVEGKTEEALAFCEDWYKKESGNVLGATSLIYARTAAGDFEGANQIVEQYISEDGSCTDENDIVYIAAELLYKVSGNKKAEKRISQAIQKYEKEVEAYFSDVDESALDFCLDDIDDADLPFN
ncbi:MAG: hypothetical protein LUK37_10890 [Clostridia bacterium]|nr:hypothetical protein [Clostridia bacterium]